jgi:16S rRNA processing protein RimM
VTAPPPGERLVVALVRGFQGIRGAVRVEVLTDDPEARYAPGTRLYPEGTDAPLTIAEARPADPGWILRFREVPSREAAESLRDCYLEMAAAVIPPLPEGTYYWHEFFGVPVSDPSGALLGMVRDVYRSGGAEILVVEEGPRGPFDLPVAHPFLCELAPREGRIVADPAALDLPELAEIKPPRPPRPPRPRRATRRRPAVPMPPPRQKEGGEGAAGGEVEAAPPAADAEPDAPAPGSPGTDEAPAG